MRSISECVGRMSNNLCWGNANCFPNLRWENKFDKTFVSL